MSKTNEVVEAITHYQPEQDDWTGLDDLVQTLWGTGEPQKGVGALFGVFERFPDEDGYGVFWAILHGLESLPDYEPALIASLRRQPMEFNVMMVSRILNVGQARVGGIDGLTLLGEVLTHPKASEQTRQEAARYIERHRAAA